MFAKQLCLWFLYLFSKIFSDYSGILWGEKSLGSNEDLQPVVESEVTWQH